MKSKTKKMTPKAWVENEVSILDAKYKKAKFRYKVLATVLALLNLAAIIIASVAIEMIVSWKEPTNTGAKAIQGGHTGLILAILAGVVVITIFVLNFVISLMRSLMRTKYYKRAKNEIYLEVMKFENEIGIYKTKTKRNEKFKANINLIKETALNSRRQEGKKIKVILRAFTGGFDD